MTRTVVLCGKLFDGLGDALRERMEIRIEDGVIAEVSGAVGRPSGAQVIDLSDRTVAPASSTPTSIFAWTAST